MTAWWGKQDSNLRRRTPADLQSAPFATRDIPPRAFRASVASLARFEAWLGPRPMGLEVERRTEPWRGLKNGSALIVTSPSSTQRPAKRLVPPAHGRFPGRARGRAGRIAGTGSGAGTRCQAALGNPARAAPAAAARHPRSRPRARRRGPTSPAIIETGRAAGDRPELCPPGAAHQGVALKTPPWNRLPLDDLAEPGRGRPGDARPGDRSAERRRGLPQRRRVRRSRA